MRSNLITAILFMATFKMAMGQEIPPVKVSYSIYKDAMISNVENHHEYPQYIGVADKLFVYLKEFLANNSSSSLYEYINSNDWKFVSEIDTTLKMNYERIPIKKLIPSSVKDFKISNQSKLYMFSPVIYSKDFKKAFLINEISTREAILAVTFMFYENRDGRWICVKNQIPYIIN